MITPVNVHVQEAHMRTAQIPLHPQDSMPCLSAGRQRIAESVPEPFIPDPFSQRIFHPLGTPLLSTL